MIIEKMKRSVTYTIGLLTIMAFVAPELTAANREVPLEIQRNLQNWVWIANSLRFLQVALGIGGVAAALIVTTFTDELGNRRTKLIALIAALCIGILTAFDIGSKANSTRRAWRHVTTAILKYQSDPSYEVQKLIDAYAEAEVMVGDVQFRMPAVDNKP